MRHVDEGTLHAWLDAQITDPAEVAWIEEHLRWCAACATRLAEEQATLEQANELLSATAPASAAPGFQDVLARADARSAEAAESVSVSRTPHNRRWLLQAGWAASLIFAVGIGWLMRGASDDDNALPPQMVVAERVGDTPSNQAAAAPAQEAASSARAAQPADTQAARQAESQAPIRSRQQSAVAAAPPVVAPPSVATSSPVAASPGGAEPAAPFALAPASPPTALARAAADSAGGVAAPPPGPVRLPEASPDARVEGRAERTAVSGERAVANMAAAAAAAPAAPAAPIEWRTVPRTEAAVRSGMPLYGINGVEPVVTTVRTDGRAVRTTYRLETGVMVELEQERAPFGTLPTLASAESTRRALAPGAGAPALADAATKPRVWSETRGTVRVSLRTISDAADLSALGARLRIE